MVIGTDQSQVDTLDLSRIKHIRHVVTYRWVPRKFETSFIVGWKIRLNRNGLATGDRRITFRFGDPHEVIVCGANDVQHSFVERHS